MKSNFSPVRVIFFGILLMAVVLLGAEPRSTVYYTFAEGHDYTRTLRTAFCARGWEIVESEKASNQRILQLELRFDEEFSNGLLIFDRPPTRLSAFRFKLRGMPANEGFLSANVAFGLLDGGAAVFKAYPLPADGEWQTYAGSLSEDLNQAHVQGAVVSKDEFLERYGSDPVVDKIFVHFRLPPRFHRLKGQTLYVEIDRLEGFTHECK